MYVETEQVGLVVHKSLFGGKLMYPLNENMNWEEVERYIDWGLRVFEQDKLQTERRMESQVGQSSALSGVTTPPHWDCVLEEVGASESSKSRSMNSETWVLGFVFGLGSGQVSDF